MPLGLNGSGIPNPYITLKGKSPRMSPSGFFDATGSILVATFLLGLVAILLYAYGKRR